MVFMAIMLLVSPISFAAEKGKQEDGPLQTERFKTKHGSVVRNEFDSFRHTCIDSNADSRASARNGVCFIETKVGGNWVMIDHNASRDASVWRSLPAAVLNGTGAAAIQGNFAVRAAEAALCHSDACRFVINNANSAEGGAGGAGGLGGNANATGGAGGNSNATGGSGGNSNATGGNSNATGGNANADGGNSYSGGSSLNVGVNTNVIIPCTSGCD